MNAGKHIAMGLIGLLVNLCGCSVIDSQAVQGTLAAAPAQGMSQRSTTPSLRLQIDPHDGHTVASPQTATRTVGRSEEAVEGIIEAFRHRYVSAGRPRIAVFFNRELSDDIAEWQAKPPVSPEEGDHVPTAPTPVEQANRAAPPEDWVWEFEEGFVSALVEEQVDLVDRATILRRTAAAEGEQSSNAPLGHKRIEIEALVGFADLYMELLIKQDATAQYGYRFHVKVIDVSTGSIRTSLTTYGRLTSHTTTTTRRIVAAPRGLDWKTDEFTVWPTLREVGQDLAHDAMQSLSKTL